MVFSLRNSICWSVCSQVFSTVLLLCGLRIYNYFQAFWYVSYTKNELFGQVDRPENKPFRQVDRLEKRTILTSWPIEKMVPKGFYRQTKTVLIIGTRTGFSHYLKIPITCQRLWINFVFNLGHWYHSFLACKSFLWT